MRIGLGKRFWVGCLSRKNLKKDVHPWSGMGVDMSRMMVVETGAEEPDSPEDTRLLLRWFRGSTGNAKWGIGPDAPDWYSGIDLRAGRRWLHIHFPFWNPVANPWPFQSGIGSLWGQGTFFVVTVWRWQLIINRRS